MPTDKECRCIYEYNTGVKCECSSCDTCTHNFKTQNNSWVSVDEKLPPCNVVVRVLLTNGVEAFDFVNEPFDQEVPFQYYLVSHWRMPTTEELRKLKL